MDTAVGGGLVHGIATGFSHVLSGQGLKEIKAKYKEREVEAFREKYPHLFKASEQLRSESKEKLTNKQLHERRSSQARRPVINLTDEAVNNCARGEYKDEYVDSLKTGELTYSAMGGGMKKAQVFLNTCFDEDKPGRKDRKQECTKEQVDHKVEKIKGYAYDFAALKDSRSAYLITWPDCEHTSLVIGDPDNSIWAGFAGSENYVNWVPGQEAGTLAEVGNFSILPSDGVETPYTLDCHHHGKPDITEVHGVDTVKMKKEWNTIRENECYRPRDNDCTAVTARVLLSGLKEETREKMGQPRMGIWSTRNVDILKNRLMREAKEGKVPQANPDLIPESIYETAGQLKEKAITVADDLGLIDWLGQTAGSLYNRLTLDTV
ncbi:hypothetical protein [Endozoicomonas sp. OPT23]|uniref:hypothetical protein n=1 Tax=Endozoicomonas sp. OPT23 TaxID=2072845 RepID=UPI00129AFDE9|nr:hypothetical protein [Endozoicomonas sp. OPT23]